MADEDTELKLDTDRLKKLGTKLSDRFKEYEKSRQVREEQWLKNVRQYIGEYDPAILDKLTTEQSRAYPKITRVKCLALVARLHALLFPAGEKNWGVEASPKPQLPLERLQGIAQKWIEDSAANPEARASQTEMDRLIKLLADEIASAMELVIDDQLKDASHDTACDYPALVRKVLFSGVLYGCGVLKGPMSVGHKGAVLRVSDTGMPTVIELDLYRPYLEPVSIWDYYPDFSAKEFQFMDGAFQRHVYPHATFAELGQREDFITDAVEQYLRDHADGNYRKRNHEQVLDALSTEQQQTQPGEGKKFELFEYWGSITGHDLRAAGVEVPDSDLDKCSYGCVWMIDDVVVKVAQAPYKDQVSMYHHFVFEEDEVNLTGSGLPVIMRDSQLGIATFTRMLVDNAASVCGPNVEVDLDQLAASTNPNTIVPFKAWVKDNASPNGGRAVQSISFDSHMTDLMAAIGLFREFADAETFVNPMTGGDMESMPSEALRTQGNMSMAMGNAALPFKDIVRNFDKFTSSVINALIQWNLIYHEDADTLTGDLRPIAKGASSLMAKEVRAYVLDALAQTLTPEERIYINEEELLKERLSVRDLPLEKLLATKEQVAERREAQSAQAEQAQQQAAEVMAADIMLTRGKALKETTAAQRNLDNADVATARALVEAIVKGVDLDTLRQIVSTTAARRGTTEQPTAQGSVTPVPQQSGGEVVELAGANR